MDNAIVELRGVTKAYNQRRALNGIDLTLEAGEIYGLVGNNGAGKTTMLRLLTGLSFPTAGEVCLWGESSRKGAARERSRMGMLIEEPALYPELTVRQNLRAQGMLKGGLTKEKLDALVETMGLDAESGGRKRAKQLSTGQKQRLGLAMAMVGEPELLILDEPMNGLDPEGVILLRELLEKLHREQGVTILLSSHLLKELYRLATSYIFLDRGKVIETIPAAELSAKIGESGDIEGYFMNLVQEARK